MTITAEENGFEEIAFRLAKVRTKISEIEGGERKFANAEKIVSYLRFLAFVLEAAAAGNENALAALSEESYAKNFALEKDKTKTKTEFQVAETVPEAPFREPDFLKNAVFQA